MQITIPNYSRYAATDDGHIVRVDSGKILSPRPLRNGYYRVCLTDDNGARKDLLIHRIVCSVFNGLAPSGHGCVNHKNANKTDNRPSNLEWCSCAENMAHASSHRLLSSQSNHMRLVNLMRRKRVIGTDKDGKVIYDFPTIQSARDNGHSTVSYCIKHNVPTKKGIVWSFYDTERNHNGND